MPAILPPRRISNGSGIRLWKSADAAGTNSRTFGGNFADFEGMAVVIWWPFAARASTSGSNTFLWLFEATGSRNKIFSEEARFRMVQIVNTPKTKKCQDFIVKCEIEGQKC